MGKAKPDERLVYLALKNIFRGNDAQLRKSKRVRELIEQQQDKIDVRDLIEAHSIEDICAVAKMLLAQEIFESTLKAKIRFPEVFEVSATQSAERVAFEEEAARTEADAINEASDKVSKQDAMSANFDLFGKRAPNDYVIEPPNDAGKHSLRLPNVAVPSLYPVYLPYATQHRLLTSVQTLLEKACYSFALQSLQEQAVKEDWDCPESVELNSWARHFRDHQHKFSQDDLDELDQPLVQLLDSVSKLRHTAVHRLRVTATLLEQFLTDAESLARFLRDDKCSEQISQLHAGTRKIIEDVKRNKDFLESQLRNKMKAIAARKAELDKLEQICIRDMLKEDKEYLLYSGSVLNGRISGSGTVLERIVMGGQEVELERDEVMLTSDDLELLPSTDECAEEDNQEMVAS